MEVGIVVFPGSNCDQDCYNAVAATEGLEPKFIWHRDTDISGVGAIILPGGFSYGDYLRAGAIARFSPVMKSVADFAKKGGAIFGICNGFQVLTEVGLLPGTLRMNDTLKFVCKEVHLRVENNETIVTQGIEKAAVLTMPIAHKVGNYFADDNTITQLEEEGRVVFRYSNLDGSIDQKSNPNGSLNNIAGICDETGRIVGMMPHPERRVNKYQGRTDGQALFKALTAMMATV